MTDGETTVLADVHAAVLQDDTRQVRHGVDIAIRDGRIVDIGQELAGDRTLDCTDRIALPGLINCHTHTPMFITRGWSDDEPLFAWLDSNDALHSQAPRAQKRAGARLAAVRMLETGTTTVNDMWNTYLVPEFEAAGIRALVGSTLAEDEPRDHRPRLETTREAIGTYADHPTIHPAVPVHSVYRATADLLETAHAVAAEADVPFHIHLSETPEENDRCCAAHGTTPAGWLAELGVLDERAVLAHCTHLTDRDRERIARAGAGVAHCPAANLKLGSGIADVPALETAVGLGTDSAASNNSLNLIREARTATLLHKREDPAAMTAQRALDMLTRDAAAVLGLADEVGSLEPGKRADIVLVDRDDLTVRPAIGDEGLLSNLVYAFHGAVATTIVNGEVVVRDGEAVADTAAAVETVERFHRDATATLDRP